MVLPSKVLVKHKHVQLEEIEVGITYPVYFVRIEEHLDEGYEVLTVTKLSVNGESWCVSKHKLEHSSYPKYSLRQGKHFSLLDFNIYLAGEEDHTYTQDPECFDKLLHEIIVNSMRAANKGG